MEPPKGGAEHIVHRVPRRVHRDLGDQTHPVARRNGHGALIVVQFSRQYFEQGGLACAVFAQQAHPLALVDLKGDAVQNIVPHLKGLHQAIDLNLNHRFSSALPQGPQTAWHETP